MSRNWQEAGSAAYDLMIVTCGYEARSTFLHAEFKGDAKLLVVLDYGSVGVHSYDKNRVLLKQAGSEGWIDLKSSTSTLEIAHWVDAARSRLSEGAPLRVLFDISSCSRSTMATVLTTLGIGLSCKVELTCVYAASAYFDPPDGELPSSVSEPVIGDLSGWSSDLTKPPCAIIGLGFEPGRALGSIDYLEVPEVRLFVPEGPDSRFHDAVIEANRLLLDEPGATTWSYHVLDPVDAYQKLESMILGLLPHYRPIIIPLGPKIFAAISIILALRFLPHVCIWRTSAGSGEDITDRPASGDIAIFDYIMRPALAK
jgi:hypothetical protein